MLEYTKTILEKVSFDKVLFEKELRKATAHISGKELEHLIQWCETRFGSLYPEIFTGNYAIIKK